MHDASRPSRREQRQHLLLLVAAAGFTASWLYDAWSSPLATVIPLCLLAVAFGAALVEAARLPRRTVLTAALVFAAALAVRGLVRGVPSNFYTDLYGPFGADAAGELRRHSPLFAAYRWLDALVPLTGARIFHLHRLLGALSVALLHLTLASRAESPGGFTRGGIACATFLFVVDPLEVRLHASDAVHVPALFAFATGAFLYARRTRQAEDGEPAGAMARNAVIMASIFVCAALPGLFRPEQWLFPLAYPFLAGGWYGAKDRRTWLGPSLENVVVLAAVVATACVVGARGDVASELAGSVVGGLLQQLVGVGALFVGYFATPNIPPGELALVAASMVVAYRARRARPAALLAFAVGAVLARAPSNQAASIAGWNITFGRYDIVLQMLLLTVAGDGLAELLRVVASARRDALAGPVAAVLVLAWVAVADVPRAIGALRREVNFQREYRFLDAQLARHGRACDVVTVWSKGQTGEEFETLALPHPLLQFGARDARFLVVSPDGPDPRFRASGCHLYYEGSVCQLSTDARPALPAGVQAPSIAAQFPRSVAALREAQALCGRFRAASSDVVAEDDGPALATYWPFRHDRMRLRMYRFDPSRLPSRTPPVPSSGALEAP